MKFNLWTFQHFSYDIFTYVVGNNILFSRSCLTNTFSSSGARLKPIITLAAVASHCINTAAILTDARLAAALVQVCRSTEQRMKEEES